MDKLMLWFGTYRKQIGYTIGILNLIAAVSEYVTFGEMTMNAWVCLIVGSYIVLDAYRS